MDGSFRLFRCRCDAVGSERIAYRSGDNNFLNVDVKDIPTVNDKKLMTEGHALGHFRSMKRSDYSCRFARNGSLDLCDGPEH